MPKIDNLKIFEKATSAETTLHDWNRWSRGETIFINRKPINALKAEYNKLKGRESAGFESVDDLKEFWRLFIIQPMGITDPEKQQAMLEYFNQSFHQGGCLLAMHAALCDVAFQKEYTVNDYESKTKMGFLFDKSSGELSVVSDTKIKGLLDLQGQVIATTDENATTAVLLQKISINPDNKINHVVCDQQVAHKDKRLEGILDTRSVFQKIKDFFASLFKKDTSVNFKFAVEKEKVANPPEPSSPKMR